MTKLPGVRQPPGLMTQATSLLSGARAAVQPLSKGNGKYSMPGLSFTSIPCPVTAHIRLDLITDTALRIQGRRPANTLRMLGRVVMQRAGLGVDAHMDQVPGSAWKHRTCDTK